MKALVLNKYGSPGKLLFTDVPTPEPLNDQVLIKINAASLNALDYHFMHGKPLFIRFQAGGLFNPHNRILGADMAGIVEKIGNDVQTLQIGDEVFGDISDSGLGALAQYVTVKESDIIKKPTNLTMEQAAAIPLASITALQGLRDKGEIKKGNKVLINGASGGVGTFAIQIAKSYGAEVTAVCSTRNLDIAKSLGADYVIDYTKENFCKGENKYDIILAANGYHSLKEYSKALLPKGIYVSTGGSMKQIFGSMFWGSFFSRKNGKKFLVLMAKSSTKDLESLRGLLEKGTVKALIDKSFPLEKGAEAMAYLNEGHAKGKIVLTME